MPVPTHLHALLDDATAVHAGETGLDEGVQSHREHRGAWYGDLVGPLVVGDAILPRLAQAVPSGARELEVAVAVSGGAGRALGHADRRPAPAWPPGHHA